MKENLKNVNQGMYKIPEKMNPVKFYALLILGIVMLVTLIIGSLLAIVNFGTGASIENAVGLLAIFISAVAVPLYFIMVTFTVSPKAV